MKRVLSWSRFALFGCHNVVYPRERERERERESRTQHMLRIGKKRTYA